MSRKLFSPQFTVTQPMLNHLMKIEQARGFLKATNLSNQWIKKMSQKSFLLEAHHTTHIEGTQLTFEQSKQILKGKKVPTANKEDIKEVQNYRDAFNLVLNYIGFEKSATSKVFLPSKENVKHEHSKKISISKFNKEKSNSKQALQKIITESLIKKIHKELVKGVRGGSARPGRYRNIQNYIGNAVTKEIIYIPPKPKEVPALMKDFVDWINTESDIHPVLKSGIIQFQFVHIHPFVDGNGRTSRLLCTAFLYQKDYDFKKLFSISEYYDKDRQNFYQAIQSVRNNNMDMTGWLEYFVKGFLFQMNEVMDIGKKVIFKDALVQNHNLSQRQGLIIEHILENGKLLPKDFEELKKKIQKVGKTVSTITKRTLQRDLKDMVDKNIIETEGKTNQQFYRLLK